MFNCFRKSLRQVIQSSSWNITASTSQKLKAFLDDFGDIKCKLPGKLKKDISYCELSEMLSQGHKFIIYQQGEIFYPDEFYKMSPFKDALCIRYKNSLNAPVKVFEYKQFPSFDIILLTDFQFLLYHFEDFNIFKAEEFQKNGACIENFQDLNQNDNWVAISKTSISYNDPCQDSSKNISFPLFVCWMPGIFF